MLSIWSLGCDLGNEMTNNSCNCPILESVDKKTEKGQDNSDETWKVGAKGGVEAVVKKAVDAKISVSGSYSNSNLKIEEVYKEIIGSNPQITQKANLYRSVACAYYEIACQDKTLNKKEKSGRLNEVIAGYEQNINKIISEEKSSETDKKTSLPTIVSPYNEKELDLHNPRINANNGTQKPASEVQSKEKKGLKPVYVYEDNNVLIEFRECRKQGTGLQVKLNFTAKDTDKEIHIRGKNNGAGSTKMFDNNGIEYLLSTIKPEIVIGNNPLTLVQDLPTDMLLTFQEVNEDASLVALLELPFVISGTSGYPVAKFRNLEIK